MVNDYTQGAGGGGNSGGDNMSSEDGGTSGGDEDSSNEAVLSNNVQCFLGDEAEKINSAIEKIEMTNLGVFVEIGQGTPFEELGIGDIFLLEGSEETPFGQPYIGKISSIGISGNKPNYLIETPMVDEVFDRLKINVEDVLTSADIASIETVEGVSVSTVESLDSYFPEYLMPEASGVAASTLAYRQNTVGIELLSDKMKTDSPLLFEIDVDFLKLFDMFDENKTTGLDSYDLVEGERVQVYITETGQRYHRKNCPCLYASSEELSLDYAINEGYDPCFICAAPVLEEEKGKFSAEPEMKLTGSVGLESLEYKINYDWDIIKGNGLEELNAEVNGKLVSNLKLETKTQMELEGNTTAFSLPIADVKLSGLKEKIAPIFFISYNGASVNISKSNDSIRLLTSTAPLTIGFMAYFDASGNISWESTIELGYSYDFDCSYTAIENGQWINRMETNGAPMFYLDMTTAVSGDADAHIGASVPLYIFNLNVVEAVITQTGVEAEGKAELNYRMTIQEIDEAWKSNSESSANFSIYARMYTKWFGINVKLKTKVNIVNIVDVNNYIDISYLWLDKTIVEWGQKQETFYSPDTMNYSHVTAKDENAIYYKSPDGHLVSERDGYKNTLYEEDFFSICGIDTSYIYITVPKDGDYQIYRVSKKNGTNKKILDSVEIPLLMDEKYLYYVSSFDLSCIYRIDRSNLKEYQFSDFEDNVKFLAAQDEGFYAVTSEGGTASILAALFGTSSNNYYYLDGSGVCLNDYGENPTVQQYYYRDKGSYYTASRMISSGYLRSSAKEQYWISADKSNQTVVEGISGWNPKEVGVFTTQETEDGSGEIIVLYRAADGKPIRVTDVENNQAFFTLCQSSSGTWYFFDQTEDKLILYALSQDFMEKKVVKEFELNQMPCNLSDCGMEIMDNCIYFYSMPSKENCTVLYRYIIY